MARGSIEKRGENTWRLTVDLGLKGDGTRDRPRKTITVEDKALLSTTKKLREYLEEELYKFKLEVELGEYIKPEKMIFRHFVENEWKPKYGAKAENLSPLAYKNYCGHIDKHIMPIFGNKELSEIKTLHIVIFINDLSKQGARKDGKGKTLAAGTIQYAHRVLKNILTRATEWQLIKTIPWKVLRSLKQNRLNLIFMTKLKQRVLLLLYTKNLDVGDFLY